MTNSNIFSDFAPKYWASGLPVIPLYAADAGVVSAGKRPILNEWSQYGLEMPSTEVQAHWLRTYSDSNIGLPFGIASGLCAIDIDTEDAELDASLMEILPDSPWHRVGAKGRVLIYKFSGQRNFKLRGEDSSMICEFLGQGNQAVMPPSIHPKTMKPYVANCDLWDLSDIPTLPSNIEQILSDLLGKKGYSVARGGRSGPLDIIPEGNRDVQMTRHAGYLARCIQGLDKDQALSMQDAIDHMHDWAVNFTAKVGGDNIDPSKGIAKVLEFLLKDLVKGKTLPQEWDKGLDSVWDSNDSVRRIRELNEDQSWTLDEATDWLREELEGNKNNSYGIKKAQELIRKVAKDENFTEFEMRALSTYVTKNVDGVKKSDVLAAWKSEKKGGNEDQWEDHETIARDVLDVMERDGEIRHWHDKFWQWNGSCYQQLDTEKDVYKKIATTVKGSILARRHSDYASIVKVMAALARQELAEGIENGINFANGWVSEDLVIQDHAPKFGATFTLPFAYKPELAGRATKFFEFLADCWGAEPDFADRVKALQELFAASMFGIAPNYQRAFLMYGRAGTGKTQILEILRAMLPPDATANVPPKLWGERFTLVDLIGKVVNICAELPESSTISGDIFKLVVEGSECVGEYKGQDIFSFRPRCAHWFASNYLPMSRDSSDGFVRRWLILDFKYVVPRDKRIENLAQVLIAEEREAIAAWAMEGLRRLLKQRDYTQPACHLRRLEEIRRANNSVKVFLDDFKGLEKTKEAVVLAAELYDKYAFFMKQYNHRTPVLFDRFCMMIEDLGYDVKIDDYDRYIDGIRLAA